MTDENTDNIADKGENIVNQDKDVNSAESSESTDSLDSESNKQETVVSDENASEDGKRYTEEEMNARSAKIRSIEQRRAQKSIEELNQKVLEANVKTTQYEQYNQANIPEGHIFDSVLGVIPNDMSREKYSAAVEAALLQLQENPNNVVGNQASSQPVNNNTGSPPNVPQNTHDQYYDCCASIDNFEEIMNNNPVTLEMAVAATNLDPKNGMKFLYELTKKNPLEAYKLSRLNSDQMKMELMRKHLEAEQSAKNSVLTNVPNQPKSLNGSGQINDPDKMTYAKKRAMYK